MTTIYRQGDVLLRRVQEPTEPLTRVAPDASGCVVLAHGEVTGHAHVLRDAGVTLHDAPQGRRVLHLLRGGRLLHEEHAPIALPPGWYEVRRQREYTPEQIRTVAD